MERPLLYVQLEKKTNCNTSDSRHRESRDWILSDKASLGQREATDDKHKL